MTFDRFKIYISSRWSSSIMLCHILNHHRSYYYFFCFFFLGSNRWIVKDISRFAISIELNNFNLYRCSQSMVHIDISLKFINFIDQFIQGVQFLFSDDRFSIFFSFSGDHCPSCCVTTYYETSQHFCFLFSYEAQTDYFMKDILRFAFFIEVTTVHVVIYFRPAWVQMILCICIPIMLPVMVHTIWEFSKFHQLDRSICSGRSIFVRLVQKINVPSTTSSINR